MQTVLHYLTLLLTGTLLHAQTDVEVTETHFYSNEGKNSIALCNEAEILDGSFSNTTLCTFYKEQEASSVSINTEGKTSELYNH
ncbi:MAG: hypothetical protein R2776_08055 [Flavobacteriaceae bacterium]